MARGVGRAVYREETESRRRRKQSVEHKNVSPDGSNLRATLVHDEKQCALRMHATGTSLPDDDGKGGEATECHHSFWLFMYLIFSSVQRKSGERERMPQPGRA